MANIHTRDGFDPLKFKRNIEAGLAPYTQYLRIAFDRNILKYVGRHWLQLAKSQMAWRSESRYFQRVDKRYPMPVTNLVYEKVSTVKSNLIKMFPNPYAVHRIRNHKAEQAAHFMDTAIKYYVDAGSLKYRQKISDTAGWSLMTGGCLWIPYWNLNTGKFIPEYKTEETKTPIPAERKVCLNCGFEDNPVEATNCMKCQSVQLSRQAYTDYQVSEDYVLDENGQPVVKNRIPIGDPGAEIAPYYEWKFHPHFDEVEDMPWICRQRVVRGDWVKDTYGEKVDTVVSIPPELNYKQRINSWVSGSIWHDFLNTNYDSMFMNDACVLTDIWIKPGMAITKNGKIVSDDGKHYVFGGEKIVHEEKFTDQGKIWESGQYPFGHFRFAKVPGKFHGKSMIDDIAPINDMINRIDQAIEWNRHQLDPIWVTYPGSGVSPEQLTGRYGRHFVVNELNKEPKFIVPPPLPEHVWLERDKRIEDINRLSVSEPFSGKVEERMAVGALNMALEQSATKLTEFYSNMLNGSVQFWEHVRVLLQENLTTERAFSIMGDEDEYETATFLGKGLAGIEGEDDGGVQIRIAHDDIYPQSRSAMKQLVLEGMKSGSFQPQDPFSQAIVNKILGLDREGFNKAFNVDVSAAKRKIMMMEEGIDITDINMKLYNSPMKPEADNPGIQSEIIRRYIVSEKFDRLPQDRKAIFYKHFKALSQIAQQIQKQQLEMQMQKAMAAKGSNVQV